MAIFQRKRFQILAFSVAMAGVVAFDIGGIFAPVRGIVFSLASPAFAPAAEAAFDVRRTFSVLAAPAEIRRTNEALFEENNRLRARVAELESLSKENETLRAALDVEKTSERDLEWAHIAAYGDPKRGEFVIIDKGKNRGISEGMPALLDGSVLAGRVEEAYPASAKVRLLTSADSVVNARLAETHTRCVVRGRFGLGLKLDRALPTDPVSEGDRVVTSELGDRFAPNLFIGTVREVRTSEDGLAQEATIDPGVSVFDRNILAIDKSAL